MPDARTLTRVGGLVASYKAAHAGGFFTANDANNANVRTAGLGRIDGSIKTLPP